jgi:TolB-like protein
VCWSRWPCGRARSCRATNCAPRSWGQETFVDAEAGLNTAIGKLREALGDSADTPRYIETLPRRGYRFIGVLTPPDTPVGATPVAVERPGRHWIRRPLVVVTFGVLALLAALAVNAWRAGRSPVIGVVLFHNETGDTSHDVLAQRLTDATVVALAANPDWRIIGNAAALRTPRIFADIAKIGAELRTTYLVIGQVQGDANGVVVRAHLVRVCDQTHLWAKAIRGDLDRLDTLVPQTIADAVTTAITGVKPQ